MYSNCIRSIQEVYKRYIFWFLENFSQYKIYGKKYQEGIGSRDIMVFLPEKYLKIAMVLTLMAIMIMLVDKGFFKMYSISFIHNNYI